MGIWLSGALLLVAGWVPSLGWTQDRQPPDPCAEATSTAARRDCAGRDYQRADADLNAVYRQALSTLDDDGHKTALQQAQRAWLHYRDAACAYESYDYQGGTRYAVIHTRCMTRMTAAKTTELRALLPTH